MSRGQQPVIVRRPTGVDAPALGEVHVLAWQHGYRGMMPDEYLDGLRVEQRASMWERSLGAPPSDSNTVLVAEVGGEVVGFVSFGEWRDKDREPGIGELHAINVHPHAWGVGAGRALLAGAVGGLAEMNYAAAVLWVVDRNIRARRFYEIDGWFADGAARTDEVQGVTVDEVRYRRHLAAATTG